MRGGLFDDFSGVFMCMIWVIWVGFEVVECVKKEVLFLRSVGFIGW